MNDQSALLLLTATAALLLVWAAAIVVRGGAEGKRLRTRVRAATGLDVQATARELPNIRLASADEQSRIDRLIIGAVGYNRDLPPGYTASVPFVVVVASTLALLTFWRARVLSGDVGGIIFAVASAAGTARFMFRRNTRI